jgi:hypothetical protein
LSRRLRPRGHSNGAVANVTRAVLPSGHWRCDPCCAGSLLGRNRPCNAIAGGGALGASQPFQAAIVPSMSRQAPLTSSSLLLLPPLHSLPMTPSPSFGLLRLGGPSRQHVGWGLKGYASTVAPKIATAAWAGPTAMPGRGSSLAKSHNSVSAWVCFVLVWRRPRRPPASHEAHSDNAVR